MLKPSFKQYLINEAKHHRQNFDVERFVGYTLNLSYGMPYKLNKLGNLYAGPWMNAQLAEVGAQLLGLDQWEWDPDDDSDYVKGIVEGSRYIQNKEVNREINKRIKQHLKDKARLTEAKYHGFRKPDPTDFEIGKIVKSNNIRRGMLLAGTYKRGRYHQGHTFYVEVLGFTDNKGKYGESGVKYNSARELYQANNIKNLRELEELDIDNDYGYQHYMVVKDITGQIPGEQDTFHLYPWKGRWAVGSSADNVTFYEARYVPKTN
jgi:hypothetical protein